MKTSRPLQTLSFIVTLVFGVMSASQTLAQTSQYIGGYKQIKRLGGTSQSICRPAIRSSAELQSFAKTQRQDVIDILEDAQWPGNPDDVFSAIEAGEFTERSFPVGTKLEWMGLREDGKPVAGENRQWAGKQAFEGFELNITSNCAQHQIVIPKACCNVSLIQSSPVSIGKPIVSVSKEAQTVTVRVNSNGAGEMTMLRYADGHSETLTLENGEWSGTLAPGDYVVESRSTSSCGESDATGYSFSVAPAVVATSASPATPNGFYVAPFIGRQVREIDPPLLGVQVGKLFPLSEKTSAFVQGGGSYNLDASELSMFIDAGLEWSVGKTGFIGGGVGLWDFNSDDDLPNTDSPREDVSYFIHGGADTSWELHQQPVQWFFEGRMFDDFSNDIGHHNVLKLGLRIMH